MKKCPNCGAELPREARFCTYCMTVLIKKTAAAPIKIIPRWHSCTIAFLLCLFLTLPILLAAFTSRDGRFESGNPNTLLQTSDRGGTKSPFSTDKAFTTNTTANIFSQTENTKDSENLTDKTSNGDWSASTDTETDSKPTDTNLSPGGDAFSPSEFASGDGTESDPYIIKTAAQLNEVRFHLDSHFKLENDIIFTSKDFQSSYWIPIGMQHNPFTGVFDGNGYSVKNLEIRSYAGKNYHFGLFGMVTGTIRNLGVENVSIWVYDANGIFVGSVAGEARGAFLKNCHSSGKIRFESGTALSVVGGGIIGSSYMGAVSECYNTGEIIASTGEITGGVIGKALGTKVSRCYNSGSVSSPVSSSIAGGILGNGSKGTHVYDCYNRGEISAVGQSGGIVGVASDESPTTDYAYSPLHIEACYNVGKLSARYTGGIIGWMIEGNAKNCYYLNNVNSGIYNFWDADTTYGCISCSDADMKKESTFVGFNFPWDWEMGTGDYPYPVHCKQ